MNDVGGKVTHSALPRQGRIWHSADAVDRRAAIFPKLLIAALCWIAMFFQQIEACSPDAFRCTPVVSQIKLDYFAAPDLRDFSGKLVHAASRVTSTFDFDSGGNRARQTKERIAANDSRKIEFTLYLGSYERELHQTKANGAAPAVLAKTVHRHSLGGGVIYTRTSGGSDPGVKLMAVLADHLGSTDVIVTGKWNTSTAAFANITTERQSFDAWGERRAADTQVNYRATDTDAFRTSGQATEFYHRGYTGHEQLDDSGLIHMNGRIYDPELGRFLSPDPYVQIPEYSQNFNRYSYVLNNPLNATDPSGFSFLSKFFSKVGSWIRENWRTVVTVVVGAILIATGIGASIFWGLQGLTGASILGMHAAVVYGGIGAVTGGIMGGLNAALAGGDLGDVLRGAAIGGIQGGISGGILHGMGEAALRAGTFSKETAMHIAGHGVLGGASNEAMGGKFQDGFLSAAAGAAGGYLPFGGGDLITSTVKSSVLGGTASALGGGKFANGAYTAAFQHLLNEQIKGFYDRLSDGDAVNVDSPIGRQAAQDLVAGVPEAQAAFLETASVMSDMAPGFGQVKAAHRAVKLGPFSKFMNWVFGKRAPAVVKRLPLPNNIPKNIHMGQQGKHIRGHNNFIEGRSYLDDGVDANSLLEGVHAGKYPIVGTGSRGNPIVDFGKSIGVDGRTGKAVSHGQIHFGKNGAHIVPDVRQ